MKKILLFAALCLAVTFLFLSCQEEGFQNIQKEAIIEEITEEVSYEELRKQFFQRSFLSTTNPNIIGSPNQEAPFDSNSFTNAELLGNEVYEEVSDWMKPGLALGQIVSEIGFPAWEHTFIKDRLNGIEGVVLLPFARGNGNHITAILYCFKVSNDWNFKLSYSNINYLSTKTGKCLPENIEEFINNLLFGGESLISDLNYSISENDVRTIELDCIEEWECIVPPMAITGGLPCNWEYQGEICSGGGGGSGNGGVLTSSGSSGSHYGGDTHDNGGTTSTGSTSGGDEEYTEVSEKDFVYAIPGLNLQERKWLISNPDVIDFYKGLIETDYTQYELLESEFYDYSIAALQAAVQIGMSSGIESMTSDELMILFDGLSPEGNLADPYTLIFFNHEVIRLLEEHEGDPNWPAWKIVATAGWNILVDRVHLALDGIGLIPIHK